MLLGDPYLHSHLILCEVQDMCPGRELLTTAIHVAKSGPPQHSSPDNAPRPAAFQDQQPATMVELTDAGLPWQRISGRWSFALKSRLPAVLRAHHTALMACDGVGQEVEEEGGAASDPAADRPPYLAIIAAVLVIVLGQVYVHSVKPRT